MKSKKPKILHEVGGRPMILHAFLAAAAVADGPPVVVIAPGDIGVHELIGDRAICVVQPLALGTGHAVRMAADALRGRADQVIVTYADMPLLRSESLSRLAERQRATDAALVMLSVYGEPASSFGRVIRDTAGRVVEIVEVSEARRRPNADDLLATSELNVGVYCFDGAWLWDNVDRLPVRQARGGEEYYLTDLVGLAVEGGRLVDAVMVEDAAEGLGAGTRTEMVQVERAFRRRVNIHWLDNGVTIVEPEATYIGPDVIIGQDTVIWPNTYLQGNTRIGADSVIGPNVILRSVSVGRGCLIEQVFLEHKVVPDGATVRTGEWWTPPPSEGVV